MSSSNPLFSSAADPSSPIATISPPARGRSNRLIAIVAGSILIVAAGFGIWRLMRSGGSAIDDAPVTLTRDPDPPIVPPPASDVVRSAGLGELLPAGMSLEKSLEAIARNASKIADVDDAGLALNTRAKRWEIRFPSGNTVDLYGRQLDALQVELGLVGGGETIGYVSKFTEKKPERREGRAADEDRVYMTWRAGPMRDLDAALLAKAEVSVGDRVIAQFYPPDVEKQLAELELKYAEKHELDDIRRTVFNLRQTDKSYEFVVVEQEYLSGEIKTTDKKRAAKGKPDDKAQAAPAEKK